MTGTEPESGLQHFLEILLLPDNIPIVGMMILVFFFTWLSFLQARKHDELIAEDRRDDVLKEMQK